MNEMIENKKKSEILAEAISQMAYGDLITHMRIEEIIDEKSSSNAYRTAIAKAKKLLLKEHNRVIESIRGVGYRVVMPGDVIIHSLKHYKRGFNEMKKGADTLDYAPVQDMTPDELTDYRRMHDRSITLRATLIDNGDYQGTQLFMIPRDTYQPSSDEYLLTYQYYGSCCGCDTLQGIQWLSDDDGLPSERQIKDYMILCKDIVCHMIKPYNHRCNDDMFETVTMDN